jgi:hypothetical protein
MAIGAVSASDDVNNLTASDVDDVDELAASDVAEDPIEKELADEVIADNGDPDLTISKNVNTNLLTESDVAYVSDPNGVNGVVSVSIDNKVYYSNSISTTSHNQYVYFKDLGLSSSFSGSHFVTLSYLKAGTSNPLTNTKAVEFKYRPSVLSPDSAVGETAIIAIEHLPGAKGTAILYNYDNVKKTKGSIVKVVSVVDGSAIFALNGLSIGKHYYILDMVINGQQFLNNHETLNVKQNSKGFSAKISAKTILLGKDVTVSLTGPKSYEFAKIYVDGRLVKTVSFMKGSIKELIPKLSMGKHYVKVKFDGDKRFYSKTFVVNVNLIKLTLKKVKIKKSAKKLVLKATLKVNKKAKKGLKVTFKFNGKKFKAKTNNKGIVKVTIKKKVLKKLKVGKKVKYQVSYSKKTVKKVAKVKK